MISGDEIEKMARAAGHKGEVYACVRVELYDPKTRKQAWASVALPSVELPDGHLREILQFEIEAAVKLFKR